MKRLLMLCLVSTLLTQCSTFDKFTQFEMDYEQDLVVKSNSSVNLPFNIVSPDIESNSKATFEVHDTRKDLIEEIQLTKLSLTITSPSGADFSFLESISIFLSSDNVAESKIAWDENVTSEAGSTLVLTTSSDDLKDYIKEDQFSVRLNTNTDEILTQDHHITLKATFFVDAKLIR